MTNVINDCKQMDNQKIDMGGWSFLQSLANTDHSTKQDQVYVHPLVKSATSKLSGKSLEMCTESLGSENGAEVSSNSDDISLLSLETVVCNPSEVRATRKMSRSSSFPPPLTSFSGSSGVHINSHREGGRLILEAVAFSPCHSYFHAERSEGRLKLSLLKDVTSSMFYEDSEEKGEEEEELVEDEEEDGELVEEEIEEDESYWVSSSENMEGNGGNVGGEIGTGKLPRPSSCKESGRGGHKGLLNWESFLVAT